MLSACQVVVVTIVMLLLLVSYSSSAPALVTVSTPLGSIRGIELELDKTRIFNFFGVPYAEPPERFQKPKPKKPWSDIKNAVTPGGKICSQKITSYIADQLPSTDVSEDCLLCDIYVPGSLSEQNSKAVVIWFAGDGFIDGQRGMLTANDLSIHGDVINVVVAYRLGVFGFLSTGDEVIPGNFGLWDQKMAIEWVKQNIKSFGGDSSAITIAGFEAGAISASIQAGNPMNAGNFQRLLTFSYLANTKGFIWKEAPQYAEKFAMAVCPELSRDKSKLMPKSKEIYDCLISKTESELTEKALTIPFKSYSFDSFAFSLGPVVDNDFISETWDFKTLLPVDVLITVTENERFEKLLEYLSPFENQYQFSIQEKIPKDVLYKIIIPPIVTSFYKNTSNEGGLINLLKNKYTSADDDEQTLNAVRIIGDVFSYAPTTDSLRNHVITHPNQRSYFCLFSEKSPFGGFPIPWLSGTIGIDALAFVFGVKSYLALDPSLISDEAAAVADATINYLSSFIKTGDPNSGQNLMTWPTFDQNSEAYLQISAEPKTANKIFEDRVNFWLNTVQDFISPTTTTTVKTSTTTTTMATTTTTPIPITPITTKKPLVVAKSTTTTTTSPINSACTGGYNIIAVWLLICFAIINCYFYFC